MTESDDERRKRERLAVEERWRLEEEKMEWLRLLMETDPLTQEIVDGISQHHLDQIAVHQSGHDRDKVEAVNRFVPSDNPVAEQAMVEAGKHLEEVKPASELRDDRAEGEPQTQSEPEKNLSPEREPDR
jgi:hypothetical protein